MESVHQTTISDVLSNYALQQTRVSIVPYGNGHINDTFVVAHTQEDGEHGQVLLQRINQHVFKNPIGLMKNVSAISAFLKDKIIRDGGNPQRETLTLIPTIDGKDYVIDSAGDYWRVFIFIDHTTTYEEIPDEGVFYESAKAFGTFQKRLDDYPANTLIDTIPNFHNTKMRYQAFLQAVQKDTVGRVSSVKNEIDFIIQREKDTAILVDLLAAGRLPLRVTHNDTKLNNVLFDNKTGKALCVIDLDTVMPGLSLYDFGDSIRFGASTATEDEQDLSKVTLSLPYYEAFTAGFLEAAGDILTIAEKQLLHVGAKTITLECGIRFLTDYLEGDNYFKTHRDGHNLDRARTQLKLVSEMEKHRQSMQVIASRN